MKRLWLLPLLLVGFAVYSCLPAHHVWHQKLTLVVDTPQGEVSGSSVIKVAFSGKNRILLRDLDSSDLSLTGEAAMVEVLPGRWLFALLQDQDVLIYNYVNDQQADGHIGLEEAIPMILDQHEPLTLDPKAEAAIHYAPRFPILVTFDDITKPETVRQVDPLNLEASFGPGVSLKEVTVEVTDEPVTEGRMEGLIRWLGEYPEPRLIPPDGRSTAAPFGMNVTQGEFIRRPN